MIASANKFKLNKVTKKAMSKLEENVTEVIHNGQWALVEEVCNDGAVFLIDEDGKTIETREDFIDVILN